MAIHPKIILSITLDNRVDLHGFKLESGLGEEILRG